MPAPKGHPDYATPEQQTGSPRIHTDEYMEKIAKELQIWSKRPDVFFIGEFTAEHEDYFHSEIFNTWCEKNLRFAQVYRQVRERLTMRLRKSGLLKTTDTNVTMKLLPLVDPEYKKWRQEELGLEAESKKTVVTQVISWKDAEKLKPE